MTWKATYFPFMVDWPMTASETEAKDYYTVGPPLLPLEYFSSRRFPLLTVPFLFLFLFFPLEVLPFHFFFLLLFLLLLLLLFLLLFLLLLLLLQLLLIVLLLLLFFVVLFHFSISSSLSSSSLISRPLLLPPRPPSSPLNLLPLAPFPFHQRSMASRVYTFRSWFIASMSQRSFPELPIAYLYKLYVCKSPRVYVRMCIREYECM